LRKWTLNTMIFTVAVAFAGAASADEPNPKLMPDDSWISISGTAVEAEPNGFVLDYGDGTIWVEMDDWDWYGDGYGILDGDKVTVYGEVDDDLYQQDTIEASSVYVESINSYFYANPADEEDALYTVTHPVVVSQVTLRGTVTSVSGREFTIDTGLQEMTVETIYMSYNPLDDKGYQQIDVGDRVSVSGDIDDTFFGEQELEADSIITLENNVDD